MSDKLRCEIVQDLLPSYVLFLFGHVPDQRGLRGAHVPGGPAYAGIRGTRRRVEGRVHV